MSKRNKRFSKAFAILALIVFGFFLTFSFFTILRYKLQVSPNTSLVVCCCFVIFFVLLISFHKSSRCLVLLTVPLFFSNRGRNVLIAFAYFLVLSGPAKHLIKNMNILSASIQCGEDEVNIAFQDAVDAIKHPYCLLNEEIHKVLPQLESILNRVKEEVKEAEKVFKSVGADVKESFSWLESITNTCNENKGMPFERCLKSVRTSVIKCREKLGNLNVYCDAAYLAKMFCHTFKGIDDFCGAYKVNKEALEAIDNKIESFVAKVEEIFYVSATGDYNFKFQNNKSQEFQQIHADIINDISKRTDLVFTIFSHLGGFLSLSMIWILSRAISYQHHYLTDLRFENNSITERFLEIEDKRSESNLETVLPLTKSEKKFLLATSSKPSNYKPFNYKWRQTCEKSLFLLPTTLYMCGILVVDYAIFWFMSIVRFFGMNEDQANLSDMISVEVYGESFIAEYLQEIVDVLKRFAKQFDINLLVCLPNPLQPNYEQYLMISVCIIICWLLLAFETSGPQFSRHIMDYYNPERSFDRAVWLYYRLLRRRRNFVKFARRQVRRKHLKNKSLRDESATWLEVVQAKLERFWIFRKIFNQNNDSLCLLCGHTKRSYEDLIRCPTKNCPGIYCLECFIDVKNSCPMCKSPFEYGDLSDVSEELDSSDNDETQAT